MNILFLAHQLPYPQDSGGKIKMYSTLKILAENHSIYMAAFITKKSHGRFANILKESLRLKYVNTVFHPLIIEKTYKQQLYMLLNSLPSDKPYSVYKFRHKHMHLLVRSVLQSNSIDCIWVGHPSMTQYIQKNFTGLRIIDFHDIESVLYLRHAQHEPATHWRFIYILEALKYKRLQKKYVRSADHVFTISPEDKSHLVRELNIKKSRIAEKISVLPPSVNPGFYKIRQKQKGYLLFMGLLTWHPNYQGITWFIHEVFPYVRSLIPDIKLIIVGQKPSSRPLPKASGVTYVGRVRSVRRYLSEANVFIVPLQIGGGIRIKILEAMAAGVPIVSTSIGAEGIPVTHNKHILIADDSKKFADTIVRLYNSHELQHSLRTSARRLVRYKFSDTVLKKALKKTLDVRAS